VCAVKRKTSDDGHSAGCSGRPPAGDGRRLSDQEGLRNPHRDHATERHARSGDAASSPWTHGRYRAAAGIQRVSWCRRGCRSRRVSLPAETWNGSLDPGLRARVRRRLRRSTAGATVDCEGAVPALATLAESRWCRYRGRCEAALRRMGGIARWRSALLRPCVRRFGSGRAGSQPVR
jgi:hypothetical protein